jgi:hypothetical protein
LSCIGIVSQLVQELKELLRLANKKPHRCQEFDHALGNSLGVGRTNDRDSRKLPTQEGAGLRHDEVGLKGLPATRQISDANNAGGL